MRVPFSRSRGVMRTVVRRRTSTYDITRVDSESGGRFGERSSTTTTVQDVSLWLFRPEEINTGTEYGDRLGGDLQSLSLPDADIQVNDRLTHGADTYEVQEIMHLPDNDDKVLKMAALKRVVN